VALAAETAPAEWTLADGTRLVLVEDRRTPLVVLRLELPAGRWSPWVRESGLDIAFETLLSDPARRLRQRADDLAVEIVLETGERHATLEATFLEEDLEPALALVRDVLRHEDLDRAEIVRRRRTDRLEWQSAMKLPEQLGVRTAAARVFARDDPRRLAWERPGSPAVDLADLRQARDTLLALPGRALGAAGAVDRAGLERAAAALLVAPLAAPPGQEAGLAPALDPAAPVTVELPKLTQVSFVYARATLSWTDPRYPAFLVADHVLAGHFYSRVLSALRHEGGETYGAWSRRTGDTVPGLYTLVTFTRVDNAEHAEAKLREVLRTFHEGGITEDERQRAIGFLAGRRAFDRQSPAQRLARHMEERRLGLAAGFVDALAERAAATSLEAIQALIREHYAPAAFQLVRVVPAGAPRSARSRTAETTAGPSTTPSAASDSTARPRSPAR
jgi:predicted Zn-dependent peptidase